jgi:hypothetical protein
MSEHVNEAALLADRPMADLARLRGRGLAIGAVGLVATVIGFFVEDKALFMQSYLIAFMFWLSVALGSLGLLMVQYLSGGAWGIVTRRVFEAGARTLPLLFVLFLPIALNLPVLYSWTRPGAASDPVIQEKALYLNTGFFYVRYVLYFAIWIGLTSMLVRWSREQDATAPRLPGPKDRRFRVVSGPGVVLYILTVTFVAVDWVMSLDPHFSSTIYGLLLVGGTAVCAQAFAIIVIAAIAKSRPMSEVLTPEHVHDLGKLLLAFIMLWAYFEVSQLIIIWSGNLTEEIPWYLIRTHGGWHVVTWIVALGDFFVPFALLLSRSLKRDIRSLARLALFVLVMRTVEVIWMIAPIFRQTITVQWLDYAVILAMGGIWLFFFFRNLAGRALVPAHDPSFKKALAHGGH